MNNDTFHNDALKAAAQWFVQLTSGDTTDEDRAAWHAWRQQSPTHEYAWQQIENVTRTCAVHARRRAARRPRLR